MVNKSIIKRLNNNNEQIIKQILKFKKKIECKMNKNQIKKNNKTLCKMKKLYLMLCKINKMIVG
jgi:hypothetical protein